jgi:hypothetical protein
MLHAEELVGVSCHMVVIAFNSSVVHTFLWEHASEYLSNGRKPYETRNKFSTMAAEVAASFGRLKQDVPTVYHLVGCKFYDYGLISSLDHESKVCWRPYEMTCHGFVYNSVMSWFRDVEAQSYALSPKDMRSLTYLSTTNADWLPRLSFGRLQFSAYYVHRVRRQFGFNQEIPAVMGVAVDEIPTINPFL